MLGWVWAPEVEKEELPHAAMEGGCGYAKW
jgi:hypothetical protein